MQTLTFHAVRKRVPSLGDELSGPYLTAVVGNDRAKAAAAAKLVVYDLGGWKRMYCCFLGFVFSPRDEMTFACVAQANGLLGKLERGTCIVVDHAERAAACDLIMAVIRLGGDAEVHFRGLRTIVKMTHHDEVEFHGRVPNSLRKAVLRSKLHYFQVG